MLRAVVRLPLGIRFPFASEGRHPSRRSCGVKSSASGTSTKPLKAPSGRGGSKCADMLAPVKIAVLVKEVPDAAAPRRLDPGRTASTGVWTGP